MKRAITILLALVMVLSLAACGGTTAPEPTPEPEPEAFEGDDSFAVYDVEWDSVFDQNDKVVFYKDGEVNYLDYKGYWKEGPGGRIDISYSISDMFGASNNSRSFDLIPEDDFYKLISDGSIFIPSDNYEDNVLIIRKELTENATVFDWEKAYDEISDNIVRAQEKYENTPLLFTSTVRDIYNGYITVSNELYKGLPYNAVSIYLSNDDIQKLNKGQEITICGFGKTTTSSFYFHNAFLVE